MYNSICIYIVVPGIYILVTKLCAINNSLDYFDLHWDVSDLESPDEIGKLTKGMIGYNLVTKQTPPEGVPVSKVRGWISLLTVTAQHSVHAQYLPY